MLAGPPTYYVRCFEIVHTDICIDLTDAGDNGHAAA